MTDFLTLACSPLEEDCVQVDSSNYLSEMRKELTRFKSQLQKRFPIPEDLKNEISFFIKWESHDFGRYGEVAIRYSSEKGADFAFFIESNLPERWNDIEILQYVELTQD